jgi:hypothetical protein
LKLTENHVARRWDNDQLVRKANVVRRGIEMEWHFLAVVVRVIETCDFMSSTDGP